MSTTTSDKTKLDGKWLVFHRTTKQLSFKSKQQDTKTFLSVGMVWGGSVAGKPVTYWLDEIEKQRQEA